MQENKDAMKKIAGSILKKKILIFIAPALPWIFLILMVAAMIGIIIYPVVKGGQMTAGVAGFWDRLTNTITLKCLFCTDQDVNTKKEKKFYEKVEKINELYLQGKSMNGTSIQLDIPLLLSAVFYTEDIENTIMVDADITDVGNAASGDLFGDLSWYSDQGDQRAIHWYKGPTEEAGCYILGYYYETAEQFSFGKKSKLRKLAKHMVKRTIDGICVAQHDEKGNFTGWETYEWPVFTLDIDREDGLYTMEYDQKPYKPYRKVEELAELPPTYITYLLYTYLPTEHKDLLPEAIKDLSEDHELYLTKRKVMKNVIYSYKAGYEYLVGSKFNGGTICENVSESCTYSVKVDGKRSVHVDDLSVRLLSCASNGSSAETIDFEKYITGVVYAESNDSSYEALKAHAIAARSNILKRTEHAGDTNFKLSQESGKWILSVKDCAGGHSYCDPDTGCDGKGTLDSNSDIRKAVADTKGKVLSDQDGNVFLSNYTKTDIDSWNYDTSLGNDAYEALVGSFGTNNTISSSCRPLSSNGCYIGGETGDHLSWKQGNSSWGNIALGSGGETIASAGCLATSVAIQIARSGTAVSIDGFNPATMVQYLNTHGGFSGSIWLWDSPQTSGLAPHFVHAGQVKMLGMTKQEKLSTVKKYLDQGYYLILQVKKDGTEEPGQHWVAALGVTNTDIVMADPATNFTEVWSRYKPGGTVQFHYYKKTD